MKRILDQLGTIKAAVPGVAGARGHSHMSSRGPDWFTDACTLGPGATGLITFFGAEHALGGISGYEAAETTDESPEPQY